jgi:hypothetical protein
MVMVFKIKNGMAPGYLMDKVHFRHNERYPLRNADDFKLPRVNKMFTQNCVFYSGLKLFNELPIEIKQSHNFNEFKRKCSVYIKQKYPIKKCQKCPLKRGKTLITIDMPKRKTRIIQLHRIRRENNLTGRQITKKSAKSSAIILNEEKSDESQKPILRTFDQNTYGGKVGSNLLSARRAVAVLLSVASLRLTA